MTTQGKGSRRSLTSLIVGIIVVVVALIISNLTGIDLLGVNPTATPVPPTEIASAPGNVAALDVPQGFGASKGFWQIFFNAPTGSSDSADYTGSIDTQLVAALNSVQRTLDIAAFEMNNEMITQAILEAHNRGVTVRIMTDDESGIEDDDTTLQDLRDAGIPIVDDDRSALMHNKFVIIDGATVWTGSWNYTVNGTYRNNNNALVLRSRRAVEAYQGEFDEMFGEREHGKRSPTGNSANFNQDGVPVQILFAPEDEVVPAMIEALNSADTAIRFMAFSFTLDDVRDVLLTKASEGVNVTGIFELRGSETEFSELTPLFCAGLPMRQDGNRFVLHHKVFIIDDDIVVTGSFNFSASARDDNDENVVIIQDADLAAQYIAEYDRRWAEAVVPDGLSCS